MKIHTKYAASGPYIYASGVVGVGGVLRLGKSSFQNNFRRYVIWCTNQYWGGQRRNVGKYEIHRRITKGAYWVVYKGKDTESEQIVALKVIKTVKDDGIDATTLREIGIL